MDDQDKARWTKLVADYESSELTQREFASARGIFFSQGIRPGVSRRSDHPDRASRGASSIE